MSGKLILLDGNSLLYRAFFALPTLTNARGEPTNAVYGFAVMLYKILEEEKPDYIAAAFDLPTPTFRHKSYAAYKATREKMPDDLGSQIPLAYELLEALQIPHYELDGYEADDLLGTLAKRAEAEGREVLIVSGDHDILQLVSEHIKVMINRRGVSETQRYDEAAIQERYELAASQLVDYKALRGDVTDNIPGVPGIGEKTAIALVKQFASLENILANLPQVKPAKAAAALEVYADQAVLSKQLATIACEVPLEIDWGKLRFSEPDQTKLREIFLRMGFRGLMKKLAPVDTASEKTAAIVIKPVIIQTQKDALDAANKFIGANSILLSLSAGEGSPHLADLNGILLVPEGTAKATPVFLPANKAVLAPFKALLEDEKITKTGHGLKEAIIHLSRLGIRLAGVDFDVEVASYLANPLRKNHDLYEVAFDMLGAPLPEMQKKETAPASNQELLDISTYDDATVTTVALRAQYISELRPILTANLIEQKQDKLFNEAEMPLVAVLAEMEMEGVSIDTAYLEQLAEHLAKQIAEAEKHIYILAGEEFVINSPKQLQYILYDKLQLKKGKRTKTGFSTDAGTLAKLAEEYEIVSRILSYRELSKLKSTYIDALPRLVNPRTSRIHPTFNQVVTATGRLSCSDPNMQNIPIRTELGSEIRRAFIAQHGGDKLLAADYSQIELRVLAHIAQDEALHEVFAQDLDLHTATACEVFAVKPEEVTSEMRRLAKIINFSIPYGSTPEGLASRMKVKKEEAWQYMNRYFKRFRGVARYMKEIVAQARETGEVTTILGHRRPLPEITSANFTRRELAERMAINTPIQGSAADIMKLAMLGVAKALKAEGLTSKMILQVHDELVFEGPEAELPRLAELARREMENAYQLSVPLKVDLEYGDNWKEMQKI